MKPNRFPVFTLATIIFAFVAVSFGTKASVDHSDTAVMIDDTSADLDVLKRAIIEYVSTMGSKPAKLSDLWVKGSQPDFEFSRANHVGAGWLGPYVSDVTVDQFANLANDRFGTDLNYITAPFRRRVDQQEVTVRLQSAGPDGILDSDDDIISDLLSNELFSRLTGKVTRGGEPLRYSPVVLNVPSNGIPSRVTSVTDANGLYAFVGVPFGHRSVTLPGESPFVTFKVEKANTVVRDLAVREK